MPDESAIGTDQKSALDLALGEEEAIERISRGRLRMDLGNDVTTIDRQDR